MPGFIRASAEGRNQARRYQGQIPYRAPAKYVLVGLPTLRSRAPADRTSVDPLGRTLWYRAFPELLSLPSGYTLPELAAKESTSL